MGSLQHLVLDDIQACLLVVYNCVFIVIHESAEVALIEDDGLFDWVVLAVAWLFQQAVGTFGCFLHLHINYIVSDI